MTINSISVKRTADTTAAWYLSDKLLCPASIRWFDFIGVGIMGCGTTASLSRFTTGYEEFAAVHSVSFFAGVILMVVAC